LDASFAGEAAPPTTSSHPPADSQGVINCLGKAGGDVTVVGSHPPGSTFFTVRIIILKCKQTLLAFLKEVSKHTGWDFRKKTLKPRRELYFCHFK